MCLSNISKRKIATEDIVCYKRLVIGNLDLSTVKHGDSFTGVINNTQCEGKISISNKGTYFCTNDYNLDGNHTDDKLGYNYSWLYDMCVQSITINGKELLKGRYETPYKHFSITIGNTYTSELEDEQEEINVGLHSFITLEDAKNDSSESTDVFCKCIIPKDSEYYEGTFGDAKSYASNKLTYVELVKD